MPGLSVWISIDMEGISGVVDREQMIPSGRLYSTAVDFMIADLNAVLEGLADVGGVDRICVNDSHDGMLNVRWDALPPSVELISGGTKPGSMNAGVEAAHVALYVGYHAKAGTAGAVMDHTYSRELRRVWLNGTEVGECGINAAYASQYGVPVIFLSGDSKVAEEAESLLPGVVTAVVKTAASRRSARLISPEQAHARIRAQVATAVTRYRQGLIKAQEVRPPFQLVVDLMTSDMADRAMFIPGFERLDGTRVGQTFDSMAEWFRGFYTVMALAAERPLY
jgi:D-amino peptidase